jgi:hypothetical protein
MRRQGLGFEWADILSAKATDSISNPDFMNYRGTTIIVAGDWGILTIQLFQRRAKLKGWL